MPVNIDGFPVFVSQQLAVCKASLDSVVLKPISVLFICFFVTQYFIKLYKISVVSLTNTSKWLKSPNWSNLVENK